ncbi:MAG: Dam family site-specific DNA-(adenine-N6)-methyltransferase, partial [Nitrososphaeraceae archaeon]|nr:Dam family site-specific DNA-(adenine-N6)-methyltransferase [Nitrososphaeraceae archaeon]
MTQIITKTSENVKAAAVHLDMQQQLQSNNSILRSEPPVCKPFVKWAGGKTQLLAKLDLFIPGQFNRYFEPFLGGGSLFFHITTERKNTPLTVSCSYYYLSDINPELINGYLVIRNDVEGLISWLEQHQIGYNEGPKEYYYQLRKMDRNKLSNTERAARFIALNRTCFNGLYRVNQHGLFNVPWGKYKNPRICDSDNLRNVSIALRYYSNITIKDGNYKEMLLENAREGDFIYLDPPYSPESSTACFTNYTCSGFDNKDQQELATVFRKLEERGCKVLLTNSDTPLIRNLYSGYAIVEV